MPADEDALMPMALNRRRTRIRRYWAFNPSRSTRLRGVSAAGFMFPGPVPACSMLHPDPSTKLWYSAIMALRSLVCDGQNGVSSSRTSVAPHPLNSRNVSSVHCATALRCCGVSNRQPERLGTLGTILTCAVGHDRLVDGLRPDLTPQHGNNPQKQGRCRTGKRLDPHPSTTSSPS